MADLATVFHWPPSEMDAMPPADLLRWRALAAQRNESPR